MSYINEKSNPFGSNKFIELINNEIDVFRQIPEIVDKLENLLDNEVDVKYVGACDSDTRLISVSIDGGSQEIFSYLKGLSCGIIRASASSPDFEIPLKSEEVFINFVNLSTKFHKYTSPPKDKQTIDNIKKEYFNKYLDEFCKRDIIADFLQITKITKEDFGDSFAKDITSFTNTIRDILEWAYIVKIAEKYKNSKPLIIKDGRLEQHGVKSEFRKKLIDYLRENRVFLVGVLKNNAVFNEGITSIAISNFFKKLDAKPFYFEAPKEIMEYVYANSRQWDYTPYINGSETPEEDTFMFGARFFGKLFPKTFGVLQSAIAFDIPVYFMGENDCKRDQSAINDIVYTLFKHRSVLFDGSITPVMQAHAKSSISSKIVGDIEKYLENEMKLKITHLKDK